MNIPEADSSDSEMLAEDMPELYLIALKERLLQATTKLENGCWYCSKGGKESRYGSIWYINQNINNHIASYLVHKGVVPRGMYVCHKCDNKRCINPEHLFLGTHQDNLDDMVAKGRSCQRKGELNTMAVLNENDVREIRIMIEEGYTQKLIAEYFGVSQVTISQINTKKRWAHVI